MSGVFENAGPAPAAAPVPRPASDNDAASAPAVARVNRPRALTCARENIDIAPIGPARQLPREDRERNGSGYSRSAPHTSPQWMPSSTGAEREEGLRPGPGQ